MRQVSRISLSRAAVMRPDARTGFRNFLVAASLPLHIQGTGLRKVTTDTRTEGRVKRSAFGDRCILEERCREVRMVEAAWSRFVFGVLLANEFRTALHNVSELTPKLII